MKDLFFLIKEKILVFHQYLYNKRRLKVVLLQKTHLQTDMTVQRFRLELILSLWLRAGQV